MTDQAESPAMPADPRTKHEKIVESLRQGLISGDYAPSSRLPSESELIRRFKVSRMTVVKAFQQLQQEGLVVRRVGSGTYAAPTASSQAQVFGLLIPDLGETDIFEPICRGMARSPQAAGLSLSWGHSRSSSEEKGEQARELCQHFLQQGVQGVFFAPLEFSPDRERINQEILANLSRARIPVVLLDRCGLSFPAASKHDLVGLDNRRAGYLLAEHLLARGARKFVFIAREGSVETVQARQAGCLEAISQTPQASLRRLNVPRGVVDQAIVEKLRQDAFDAVICGNDLTAANVMQALLENGVVIPDDLRIAGFDDTRYASLLPVPLTTIHQPCSEIGMAAMAAMLDRIRNPHLPPRSILLNGRLVVRLSCGKPPSEGGNS